MKPHKNFPKINRAKVGASCALGAAVSTTFLTNSVGPAVNLLGALSFGLCLGVLGWLAHGHMHSGSESKSGNAGGPANWSPALSKTYATAVVVSSFALSFGGHSVLRLMGAAGLAACVGFAAIDSFGKRK